MTVMINIIINENDLEIDDDDDDDDDDKNDDDKRSGETMFDNVNTGCKKNWNGIWNAFC